MTRAAPRIPRYVPIGKRKPNLRVRPKHHEFIRRLPCLSCFWPAPSECAHVRVGSDGGTGLKPSSRFTVPLCTDCHREQHSVGEITFWSKLGIDPIDAACRLWAVSGNDEQGLRTIERARQSIALHKAVLAGNR
jgi:hypothetical protein